MSNAHLVVQEEVQTKEMLRKEQERRTQSFTPSIWARLASWLLLLPLPR